MALAESCLARRSVDCKDESKYLAALRRGEGPDGGEIQVDWRQDRTRDDVECGLVLVMMPGESQAVKVVG